MVNQLNQLKKIKGKTNWKYLIIVLVAAVLVGGEALVYSQQFYKERITMLIIKKEEQKEQKKQKEIKELLTELLNNQRDFRLLTVTYDDIHGLWGGLKITIHGDGRVEQRTIFRQVPSDIETQTSYKQIRELIALLLKYKVWEQRVSERPPIPDESRAYLKIIYGEQNTQIWEWRNDLDKNQRIVVIRDYMKSATGEPKD